MRLCSSPHHLALYRVENLYSLLLLHWTAVANPATTTMNVPNQERLVCSSRRPNLSAESQIRNQLTAGGGGRTTLVALGQPELPRDLAAAFTR